VRTNRFSLRRFASCRSHCPRPAHRSPVADATRYGNFDDGFIYEQLRKPLGDRAISEQELLRPEAVEVWKEYQALQDKVPY
jgi:hypothetical protein